MKVNAFNVDLEALVRIKCKGFVTFCLLSLEEHAARVCDT